MRLTEKYRPRSLDGVLGQQHIRKLQRFVASPYSTCWLFEGPPGVGKSAAALALAHDLGSVDEFHGLNVVPANRLGVDECQKIMADMHTRRLWGTWNVLVLEELERLSQQATVYMKYALASENLPPLCVVVATSNDTSAIDQALLERFGRPLKFDGGPSLAASLAPQLVEVWRGESGGAPLPPQWRNWGFLNGCCGGRFSARKALDDLQYALLDIEDEAAEAVA